MGVPKAKFEIVAKDKSRSTMGKFKSRVDSVRSSIFSLKGGIIALVGAAGLGALVKSSFQSTDALAKSADVLQTNIKKLSGLRHATNLTGVSQNSLTKGLKNMVRNISDYSQGVGEAKKEIQALGFAENDLINLSPDQQFLKLSDAINKVENSTDKLNVAYKIFGGRGTDLLNTMALGSAGLNAASAEADALGVSISRVDAAKIEMANDEFVRAQAVAQGFANVIATELSPYLTALTNQFVNAAKESGGMSNFVSDGMEKISGATGFAADMVRGLQVVWLGLKTIALGANAAIITSFDEVNKSGAAAMSWIPGLDIVPSKNLSQWAENSRISLQNTRNEMAALAMQEMPSAALKKWSEEIQYESQVAAEAIAKTREGLIGKGGGSFLNNSGAGSAENGGDDKDARQRAGLSSSVDAIQQSLLTEEQRIAESYERRSFMVESSFNDLLISETLKDEMLLGLTQKFEDEKAAIAKRAEDKKRALMSAGLGAAANIFGSLSSLMSKSGKKQSTMQKVFARAGIVASTAQAIMNALAVPPYPLGIALAAGAALQGAKQLRAVGGGGGGGSISAPVASGVNQAQQSQAIPIGRPAASNVQDIRVTIVGWEGATPDQIDQMAESLSRNMANGGRSPVAA